MYNTLSKIFEKRWIQWTLIGLLAAGTLGIMYPQDIYWMRWIANHALYAMILLFGIGMFFMLFDAKRLMFFSLFCCGILCLFLKRASNTNIVLPIKNKMPAITVGLFNVLRFTDDLDLDIEQVRQLDADVVIFQEVTPDWVDYLRDELNQCYDQSYFYVRIDPFGQAFFSKSPIEVIDTLYFNDIDRNLTIPNFRLQVELESKDTFSIVSLHSLPLLYDKDFNRLSDHLTEVSHLLTDRHPQLVTGDLNIPAWNPELQNFKYVNGLKDSRRSSKLFKMPFEHIFYSEPLECIEFTEVKSGQTYIGIVGTYQPLIE